MNGTLKDALDAAGGVPVVAAALRKSVVAVYKWANNNALPRTEYTGETNYSEVIAKMSKGAFTAKQLRDRFKPEPKTA